MPIKIGIAGKLASIAAAAVVLVGFTAGANAYQCKVQPESAVFVSPDAGAAMHTSRALWSAKVKQKFGLEWSVYSIAANPSQNCFNGGGGIQCTVIAKPCKYVVQ
jgi:hypothetical protein